MIRFPYFTLSLALVIASCDSPPVDNSPVAPEVMCQDPGDVDNDSALECAVPDPDLPVQDLNTIKENNDVGS